MLTQRITKGIFRNFTIYQWNRQKKPTYDE